MNSLIKHIEDQYKRKLDKFNIGDTVKVAYKVKEGDKERIQIFQGIVISQSGGGMGETFTVRKISAGIGVERIFPINSPWIESVKVSRYGRVRRAKLFFLRERKGKKAKVPEAKRFEVERKTEKKTRRRGKITRASEEEKN
ncbi:MAG: 50S ribosomal protein L19 [Candidatus Coatesbacteria bacterium]|nr:50S ribosomal protein L19 [Candidatus Coatesbacteria bacterium]